MAKKLSDFFIDLSATLLKHFAVSHGAEPLTADLREKKEGAVAQIPLLELALSRFKDPGGGYARDYFLTGRRVGWYRLRLY